MTAEALTALGALATVTTAGVLIGVNTIGRVGSFGDIPFVVNQYKVQTINNELWSGNARYEVHERHLNNALTEFTGVDPDEFSFDMTLYSELGVSVLPLIITLWEYKRKGLPQTLVIGEKIYGKYKWVIEKLRIKPEARDQKGNLMLATVSVSLLEYLRK